MTACKPFSILILTIAILGASLSQVRAEGTLPQYLMELNSSAASAPKGAAFCLGVDRLISRWIGAQVRRVKPGSAAEDAGLKINDVIILVGYQHGTAQEVKVIGRAPDCMLLEDAVMQATAPPFEMLVVRDGEILYLQTELKECDGSRAEVDTEIEVSL